MASVRTKGYRPPPLDKAAGPVGLAGHCRCSCGAPDRAASTDVSKVQTIMATNTGKGYREGSVSSRTQIKTPLTDNYTKRNDDTGRFMA